MINFLKDAISLFFYAGSYLSANKGAVALVYHSVGRVSIWDDPYKLNIDPFLFERQMQLISLLKERQVIVTFDDGFANIFKHAIPVILRYNIKSIVFITTGFIEGKVSFASLFAQGLNLRSLTWEDLLKMADAGIEIGSHTVTHPNLAKLDSEAALKEIRHSKKIIEERIGRAVKYFAYPFGSRNSFNNKVKNLVQDSGYEMAYTNIMGFNDNASDPYELRRIRIYSNDNILRFKMKLRGAYNWVDNYVK